MSAVHAVVIPPIGGDGHHEIKLWAQSANYVNWQCTTHARTGVAHGFEDSRFTANEAAWACRRAVIEDALAARVQTRADP